MQFELRVIRGNSAATTITLDAADSEIARQRATLQGYTVLKAREISGSGLLRQGGRKLPLGQFSQELLTLIEAGLSVIESIETLLEKESKAERRELLTHLSRELYQGKSLSQAMEQFPHIFPPLYIAMLRASEKTGDLPEALRRYVEYHNQIDVLRKKIVSASLYPAMLLGTGLMVILFLLIYVIPKFAKIFEGISGDIPFTSRMLIRWGSFVQGHGMQMAVGALVVLAVLVVWLSRPGTRRQLFDLLTRIPALGERVRMYQLARFYRTLGMLLRGGMPIMVSLQMTQELLQQPLRDNLRKAAERIREGVPISTAMQQHELTTSVAVRMLRVGEQSGRMSEMMERLARLYDDEIARWTEWFVRLFEPILMAVIGVIIGGIVVMMYFPIFELAGSIQ
jgi:general secretion pathway protein F